MSKLNDIDVLHQDGEGKEDISMTLEEIDELNSSEVYYIYDAQHTIVRAIKLKFKVHHVFEISNNCITAVSTISLDFFNLITGKRKGFVGN